MTAALALALAAAGSAGLSASAAEHDPTVVATGLNSPRHLSFAPNGDLYVAESGAPSDSQGPCTSHPEFGDICLDDTSSITKISRKGGQSRGVDVGPPPTSGSVPTSSRTRRPTNRTAAASTATRSTSPSCLAAGSSRSTRAATTRSR